eukprot:CAMPEP_0177632736 /NCGR_PEP_ID=MMETSP0447-20121125/2462_1 /TAXON_ID=0 /ORGANISM="Stygamoeba regulata, Strain BSH-02190019" /LENGTH=50 /DNA_ID=CAMNT_0019134347 /DNA_START=798 /DNA_END=950 /DNA_ORIENTATION=-
MSFSSAVPASACAFTRSSLSDLDMTSSRRYICVRLDPSTSNEDILSKPFK